MKQVPILLILIAVLILITASTAGAISNAAVLYLRVAAGARPAGMGEAFVSVSDDATATYWNPAGLGGAPLSGRQETMFLSGYNEITDVVTMRSYNGKIETWVIAGDQLVMHDGKTWNAGRVYMTSSDQTLDDFMKTILNIDDEEKLKSMAVRVVTANCDVTETEIDDLIETVRANVPAGYAETDDLNRGLDTLRAGYKACLLNVERFRSIQDKLREGMKDGSMTGEELDKITYSLEQAILRFLPARLMVPFSAAISGRMSCLSATGSYLWVGTDNGLYRHSGLSWARYTVAEHGLPSDTVLDLAEKDEHLLIGTAAGMAKYYHGAFSDFPDLPKAPVSAVTIATVNLGYAVIGNVLYRYDGQKWHESFAYKVRIDDTIEKIVERIAIYHTPQEYEYLTRRIRELNSANVPSVFPDQVVIPDLSAPDSSMVDSTGDEAEITEEMGTGEDIPETPSEEMVTGEDIPETPSEEMVTGEDIPETPTEETMTEEEIPEAPSDLWLVEGNVIQLPYSSQFRYDVTALFADDIDLSVWVGTAGGLLAFNGQSWHRYGYRRYVVPGPDSSGVTITKTAFEIARENFPTVDSTRLEILAENIDEYNDLNGQPVTSGQAVYVYSHNTGASINCVGKVFGELFVATEYSLEKFTADGWEPVGISGLEWQEFKSVYDYEGQAYFIAANGLGVETKGRKEFIVMFVKWLPNLDLDMYYGFVSYVHNMRGLGTFGISIIYLSYGNIDYTDEAGQPLGQGSPFEIAFALSYGTSLNAKLKLGGTLKMIYSHLSSIGAGQEQGSGIAWAFAVDAGMLFKFTERMQLGAALTNLGPNISYIDAAQADPLPRNLAVGISYRVWDTPYNSLVVQTEMNEMLVKPYLIKNAIYHVGAEYWYSDFIAFRAGYKHDDMGQVKHLTFGAGLQYNALRFDLAYVPSSVDSPLANTLRISFSLMF